MGINNENIKKRIKGRKGEREKENIVRAIEMGRGGSYLKGEITTWGRTQALSLTKYMGAVGVRPHDFKYMLIAWGRSASAPMLLNIKNI